MIAGTLLSKETSAGNYVSRCIFVVKDLQMDGLIQFVTAMAIGAAVEGDVAFFDDPHSCLYLDVLPFGDYQLEQLRKEAERRLNAGIFEMTREDA